MNRVYRSEGKYNWLNPSQVSGQYVFTFRPDAPEGLQRSFLIDIEKDYTWTGTPYEVALKLQEVIDSYFFNTDQPKIKAVVEYLEKWDDKDRYDALVEKKAKLTKQLAELDRDLAEYDPAEMENWTPESSESTEQPSEAAAES
ncbi:hypothetical protein OMP38_14625 [Cohnella ginsengisoli]|uniref:Uncharacterized protein n=1 Tax=Cohnella ginsengisoli TaxID=425004 RepID=A0A9X4KGW2_9BACL|nr:hypothetical protein [Cohnella ginsengisoli]MDG0791952.1 hypothetical protein [Cohnella ginsengisoli]